jgi:oxygen-dependent protoporphyrinogen oxidase
MTRTVAVIGAGVSGLAVACEVAERAQRAADGIRPLVLETADRAGGNIRSERSEGFLCEWGPNGFLDNAPTTLTLVRRLGLEKRRIVARPEAAVRFIYRRGKLRRVPMGPGELLRSDLLSVPGRLRVPVEYLVPRRRDTDDESVYDFARRRIGREAASTMIDAMVGGIFAGDSRKLSVASAFPKMVHMEAEHGGLIRALLARRKQARAEGQGADSVKMTGGDLNSFKDGMQELIDAMVLRLGDNLHTGVTVRSISDMGLRGFRIHFDRGAPMNVDAVVLACPSTAAANMVHEMDAGMAAAMQRIPSAPVAVVHLGYRTAALGDQPTGFGFLVPRSEEPRILGSLWSSQIFEGRAPEGSRLLTTMVGGASDPEAVSLDDRKLLDLVRKDLNRTMGVVTLPYFSRVHRHHRGIPQYTLGHAERLAIIRDQLVGISGLWVAGNSYGGVSVNACVEEAPRIAEEVLEHLSRASTVEAI